MDLKKNALKLVYDNFFYFNFPFKKRIGLGIENQSLSYCFIVNIKLYSYLKRICLT